MLDEELSKRDASTSAVPFGRWSRIARLGVLAVGVAGNLLAEGTRHLAQGKRPRIGDLLLTPENAYRVAARHGSDRRFSSPTSTVPGRGASGADASFAAARPSAPRSAGTVMLLPSAPHWLTHVACVVSTSCTSRLGWRWAGCEVLPVLFPQVNRTCDSFSQWSARALRSLGSAVDPLAVNEVIEW